MPPCSSTANDDSPALGNENSQASERKSEYGLSASQSMNDMEDAALSSPIASFIDLNLYNQSKKRGRPKKKIEPHWRVPRSVSRRREHSEEEITQNKRQKDEAASSKQSGSRTAIPDQATMHFMDNLVAKFSEAVNAKINANNTEQLSLLGKLSDEMTALRTDVNTRLSITEKKVAKLEIDQNERLLELENANIALVEKNNQLHQEMININAYNNILAKNVDDLNQDKRNLNMYMVGPTPRIPKQTRFSTVRVRKTRNHSRRK